MKEVKFLGESELCRGRRVRLLQRRYLMVGREVVRDIINFGEAVAVVPLLSDGRVIILKQFRAPVGRWVYEIPAGRVEEGERPEEAAMRELVEEAGFTAGELVRLVSVLPSPGYSDEVLHVYLARSLKHVGSRPELGELIEVEFWELKTAIKKLLSEEVVDAKTLLALMLVESLGVR